MGHTTGAQRRTNSILNLSPASPTVGELSSVTAGEGSGGVSTTRDQDAAVARLEAQLRRMGTELTAVKTQLRELTPPVHDPASAKSDEAQPVDEWVAQTVEMAAQRSVKSPPEGSEASDFESAAPSEVSDFESVASSQAVTIASDFEAASAAPSEAGTIASDFEAASTDGGDGDGSALGIARSSISDRRNRLAERDAAAQQQLSPVADVSDRLESTPTAAAPAHHSADLDEEEPMEAPMEEDLEEEEPINMDHRRQHVAVSPREKGPSTAAPASNLQGSVRLGIDEARALAEQLRQPNNAEEEEEEEEPIDMSHRRQHIATEPQQGTPSTPATVDSSVRNSALLGIEEARALSARARRHGTSFSRRRARSGSLPEAPSQGGDLGEWLQEIISTHHLSAGGAQMHRGAAAVVTSALTAAGFSGSKEELVRAHPRLDELVAIGIGKSEAQAIVAAVSASRRRERSRLRAMPQAERARVKKSESATAKQEARARRLLQDDSLHASVLRMAVEDRKRAPSSVSDSAL